MQNDELHAMDYLVYAYLQTARDKAARWVEEQSRDPASHLDPMHVGAARAAELAGDAVHAKDGYAELSRLAAKADTDRPELQQARAFVRSN